MRGQEVIFSSARTGKGTDEWGTPPDLYNNLDSIFHFDLDPCCTVENQKCEIGFGLDRGFEDENKLHFMRDGLKASFGQYTAFVNPPQSQLSAWIKKCHDESVVNGSTVVMLIPARTGRTAWQKYVLGAPQYGETGAAEIWYVDGRISFFGKIKKPGQPKDRPAEEVEYEMGYAPGTFDSAVVVFRWPNAGEPVHRSYVRPQDRVKKDVEE